MAHLPCFVLVLLVAAAKALAVKAVKAASLPCQPTCQPKPTYLPHQSDLPALCVSVA